MREKSRMFHGRVLLLPSLILLRNQPVQTALPISRFLFCIDCSVSPYLPSWFMELHRLGLSSLGQT
ncbi:hypothetical protein GcC1_04805 [Golovinomyces cichoracearum]|uniref:Uncharacterized protein n=1 Tax=Golovinomyces cichoracearum TaxID=62708 RepID=A0A420J776_9PEZI|nr:hypothetical protein GcC1_04805 [Golovinomyces cichoracearum]